jgi:hypothetical protein
MEEAPEAGCRFASRSGGDSRGRHPEPTVTVSGLTLAAAKQRSDRLLYAASHGRARTACG